MENSKNNCWFYRILIYSIGLVVLSIGITLNTKSGLGVSPIISIPFSISSIFNLNFATMTFVVYTMFVIISVLINFFNGIFQFNYTTLWQNLLLLLVAIIVTSIGAAMTVNMKLVPNPADGLAQAVGDLLNKGLGFGKNTIDLFSVATTCGIGLLFTGNVVAIGLGTLIAMIGVGRCIALFNFVFKKKMDEVSGLVNYEVEVEVAQTN